MKIFFPAKLWTIIFIALFVVSCQTINVPREDLFIKFNLDWKIVRDLAEQEERTHGNCSWDGFLYDVKSIEEYSPYALKKYAKYNNIVLGKDTELFLIVFKTDCGRKEIDYAPIALLLKESNQYQLIHIDRTSE